ncbi:Splicing factor 3B subunit 2 [Operophtera brumata]|uniref:Splicing factor 3B subunit 2 n=1 Tax=Operophtera brumata TaxID=104452 RepID=A0A0L7KRQ4_OPEBR|nr:Splicing factor 3B subunit 2 [Operophtera brumata]
MTIHGDLYYEGKEFETRLREKKPGDLTEELRTALGMPVGPGSHKVPPPWLIAQQRYGPPPSYPNLKIPGLNAPIPDACAFGYHAGGWGKPPVDETGKPLYGDVFGHQSLGQDKNPRRKARRQPTVTWLLAWPLLARVWSPLSASARGDTPALYQVLPERRVGLTAGMMASTHVYDINAANPGNIQVLPERRVGLTAGMMASTHVYDYNAANPGNIQVCRSGAWGSPPA